MSIWGLRGKRKCGDRAVKYGVTSSTQEVGSKSKTTISTSSLGINHSSLLHPISPPSSPNRPYCNRLMWSAICESHYVSARIFTPDVSCQQFDADKFFFLNPIDLGDQEGQPIPLPNVSSSVLTKILEYCDHHKNDPLPTGDANDADDSRRKTSEIGDWDARWMWVIPASFCLGLQWNDC